MEKGKVWLVGAGPSDPELLTIRAKKVLEEAEVVVYDKLVGQSVLLMMPADAELIDVGKRAGNHPVPQEEINKILLQKALEGKKVVRLKGGDPFLFGRGGEELELLTEHEIPFEIIPGITSAISVPAFQGIPVTHRDYCSSLHIITGHKGKDKPYDIDFEALVRTGGTLIFLMGVGALSDICNGLLNAGIEKTMPAAILQKGTTARQKRIVATVETLEEEVKKQGIDTPAIIVVGKVCSLAEKFSWYEKRPLAGCKVLVTRPKELASALSEKLRNEGAEVLELPAITTIPINENERLKKALCTLESYDWVVFTSPSGVDIFFEEMKKEKIDIRKLGRSKIAAVGNGTRSKIEERGFFVDLMPEHYDGKALGILLSKTCKDGDRILIPRAKIGNKELVEEILSKVKAEIDDIPTYDTVYVNQELIHVKNEFETGMIDYALFTSSSIVKGFAETTKGLDYSLVRAICIGKQTEDQAKKFGMKTVRAKEATIDSLVEALKEIVNN